MRRHAGVDDCDKDEDEGQGREGGEFFAGGEVGYFPYGRVHADELEDEVAEGGTIEDLESEM